MANQVAVRDLVEEAKKRIVILVVCVVGLSYLMSLTSSSVWVNLPAAASLIIILRYLSLDFEMKRKAAAYNNKASSTSVQSSKKPPENPKVVAKFEWRAKVNSPVVEDAIDHFTRHLVSEWVTDLWYSRLTPDKKGPEELVQIMNGVLGEISGRMRNINLIDFLIRDLINLICTHLELFRAAHSKIEKQHKGSLTIGCRDTELKLVLAAENKLHPALFSAEAEHKVLQHLMSGLMSVTVKSGDLQCSFFRYTVRELLACAVMRPVLNLANPRFINERIESVVVNKIKVNKGAAATPEASDTKVDELQIPSDHFSECLDPSATGVELVQLRNGQSKNAKKSSAGNNANDNFTKDPLLAIDARSSRSWTSLPANSHTNDDQGIQQHHSGGEWGDILDVISRRKTQALAPEHFENVWTKGKNYKKKDGENQSNEQVPPHPVVGKSLKIDHMKATGPKEKDRTPKLNPSIGSHINSGHSSRFTVENAAFHADKNGSSSPVTLYKDDEHNNMHMQMDESESSTSCTSEDDETTTVTGLGSPVTKVWDGRTNRKQAVTYVHHPLENSDNHGTKKRIKSHPRYPRLPRTQSGSKRSRPSGHDIHTWQEVERTRFLSGDGQDILSSLKSHVNYEDTSDDDDDTESLGRIYSGATASSSASSNSKSESHSLAVNPLKSSSVLDSFFKLKCEVLGASIVKSGSRTFAVYSISVTDVNNNTWSIKRRFRHFEELHRRLKEFPEYNLHLPPKHFLSTGLDIAVIQERCEMLDKYLKQLMQMPTVSGSIEVWDFLSVDSQTYIFSNSFSIMETLSGTSLVGLDAKSSEKTKIASNFCAPASDTFASRRENYSSESKEAVLQTRNNVVVDGLRSKVNGMPLSLPKKNAQEPKNSLDNSGSKTDIRAWKSAPSPNNLEKTAKGSDSLDKVSDEHHDTSDTLPIEWVQPNLSVPILDLVDVIFNLQDGGWIRRQAFWVAKQILQLGMGDAFDDWLIEKIQLLRKGSVVASGVERVERILWPDGIFLTKHPNRRPPPPSSPSSSRIDDEQQREADRRAKFVYELMIDQAPPAIVGLVGRKEYEQCARDLYFFLQSSVCLKQLAFDLLELLLLSAFPELDDVFKQLREEKHKFGEFRTN